MFVWFANREGAFQGVLGVSTVLDNQNGSFQWGSLAVVESDLRFGCYALTQNKAIIGSLIEVRIHELHTAVRVTFGEGQRAEFWSR